MADACDILPEAHAILWMGAAESITLACRARLVSGGMKVRSIEPMESRRAEQSMNGVEVEGDAVLAVHALPVRPRGAGNSTLVDGSPIAVIDIGSY